MNKIKKYFVDHEEVILPVVGITGVVILSTIISTVVTATTLRVNIKAPDVYLWDDNTYRKIDMSGPESDAPPLP